MWWTSHFLVNFANERILQANFPLPPFASLVGKASTLTCPLGLSYFQVGKDGNNLGSKFVFCLLKVVFSPKPQQVAKSRF